MRILLVDNYDSFTFNLFQALAEHGQVTVLPNDGVDGATLQSVRPDALVISPGPGRPDRLRDVRGSRTAAEAAWGRIPILGVCLGHQMLGLMDGASLERAPQVRHGKVSPVRHRGDTLFDGVPRSFEAMRYHSWCLPRVPPGWRALAESDDGVLMAMAHRDQPIWGLQFHPESIGTPWGPRILLNFLRAANVGAGLGTVVV